MRKIDEFYTKGKPKSNKSEFYLGKVSQVFSNYCVFQNENMTLLGYRGSYGESLVSNTINYLVLIDDIKGIILGRVEEISLDNSDSIHDAIIQENKNRLHPVIKTEILGIYSEKDQKFDFNGLITAGIGDKVYAVTGKIKRQFFESLGLHGNLKDSIDGLEFSDVIDSQGNHQIFSISASDLLNHHLLVTGATNSGKSSSALAILDQLYDKEGKFIIIDPTGEYKNSFKEEQFDKEEYIKAGTLGENLFFSSGKLSRKDWRNLFKPNNNTQPYELDKAIRYLKYQEYKEKHAEKSNDNNDESKHVFKMEGREKDKVKDDIKKMKKEFAKPEVRKVIEKTNFDLSYLAEQIEECSAVESRSKTYEIDSFKYSQNLYLIEKIEYFLENYKLTEFFKGNIGNKEQVDDVLADFLVNDECRCLYIGAKSETLGSFLVNYISRYLLKNHTKENDSIVLFIDEAHKYLTQESATEEYASELVSIAREGRKQGIFLFLSTQSPSDLPSILLSQMGMLLLHRLTGIKELETIKNFASRKVLNQISNLKQGEAILTGVNLIAPVDLQVHRSSRKHDNETPPIIGKSNENELK